jgi:hypothetical protein
VPQRPAPRSGPRLVKVTGRLTYKGEPIPNTDVKFIPEDGGRPSHGLTNKDGEFTLKFTRTEFGVTPGRHTVILTYDAVAEEQLPKEERVPSALRAAIARYGDVTKSELHFDVKEDDQVIPIALE